MAEGFSPCVVVQRREVQKKNNRATEISSCYLNNEINLEITTIHGI
jgi:hypothetical protein